MDTFNTPYWSLEQLEAWALTRDRELVTKTAPTNAGAGRERSFRISIETAVSQHRQRKGGRDIQGELWSKSGVDPKKFAVQDHGIWIEAVDPTNNGEADTALIERKGPFPILEYLVQLFRNERLTASGNPKGQPTSTEISARDWAFLSLYEISDRIEAVSIDNRDIAFTNVLVSRKEVLEEFPEVAQKPSADLRTLFSDATNQNGAPLTQLEAEKIARDNGVNATREKIRNELEAHQGKIKSGPKGPRKNRAARSA